MNTKPFTSRYGILYRQHEHGYWVVTACGFVKGKHWKEEDAREQAERLEVLEEAWHARR